MSPLPERLRTSLITECGNAALVLGTQLSILLDAYDFYTQRYPAENLKDEFELEDLQVSISALGSLPHQVGVTLNAWKTSEEPPLSSIGFELHVLNEFALHMVAVQRFMQRKKIDMDAFYPLVVNQSFAILRASNRVFSGKLQLL